MALIGAAIFCAVCFAVAIKGFVSIGDMTDAAQLSDAKGFAWFWLSWGLLASRAAPYRCGSSALRTTIAVCDAAIERRFGRISRAAA